MSHRRAWAALVGAALLTANGLAGCGNPPPPIQTPAPSPAVEHAVTGVVVDRYTQRPIAGAQVAPDTGAPAVTGADGSFTLTVPPLTEVRVLVDGYDPAAVSAPTDGQLTVRLRPNVLSGRLTDDTGEPVGGARVFVDGATTGVETDRSGRYRLAGVPADGIVVFKAAGFRVVERAAPRSATLDMALEPFAARALYAPAGVFEEPGRLEAMLDLIERTDANALVIDVKETDGRLYYATDLPEAVAVGAVPDQPVLDLETLLPELRRRGVYSIARMVVAKDNTLGAARPELAVQNAVTGGPWTDTTGGIWLDPFRPGVWEYVLAVASDLADRGFDEVQLDYVRFPSDGDLGQARFALPNSQADRLPAMRRLFRMVADEFDERRTFVSADVFPISFILADDQGIGQRGEAVLPYVDYLSPMIYPSHYGPGLFGLPVPNEYPYEVVDGTLDAVLPQAEGLPARVRPWIQDFGYPPFRAYTAKDVRAEIQALTDNGVDGWMIWNPAAVYSDGALAPAPAGE